MIDMRKLKELVKLMVANDLTELDIQGEGEQVTVKRGSGQPTVQYVSPPVMGDTGSAAPSAPREATADDEGFVAVSSPMVGTFYGSPSPDAEPFVAIGNTVDVDSVVCIIEAMKVFNEIKAEVAGTIEKVLVENGQTVEFDQPIMLVKPQ